MEISLLWFLWGNSKRKVSPTMSECQLLYSGGTLRRHSSIRSNMHRRDLLKASAALALAKLSPQAFAAEAAASTLKTLGGPQTFDYAWLKGRARAMAAQA